MNLISHVYEQESIEAINFEGLLIHDFAMGQSTSASFATIEVLIFTLLLILVSFDYL